MNLKNVVKVFADCETAEYLTRGKEYEVFDFLYDDDMYGGFIITDDLGNKIICEFEQCSNLKGGNWQIVKSENTQIQIRLKSVRKKAIQTHRKNNTNYTSDSAYILALIDADIEKFKNKNNE